MKRRRPHRNAPRAPLRKRLRRHMAPRPVATVIAVGWLLLAIVGAFWAAWCRPFFPDWPVWQRLLACMAPLFALSLSLLYCFRPVAFARLHVVLLPLLALACVVFAVVAADPFPAILIAPFCLLPVPFLVRELRKKPPPPHIDFFPGARTAGASQALTHPCP